MKKVLNLLLHIFMFFLLTMITQIGGVVYVLTIALSKYWKSKKRLKSVLSFVSIYLIFTYLIVPPLAFQFGRERVTHTHQISPTNYVTVLLNRNYVDPKLNLVLLNTARSLEGGKSIVEIHYLDACFPFIDKFPLLPHLSHSDGRKIDLSLIYENGNGEIVDQQKSPSGYGIFEEPIEGESNQLRKCDNDGYYQYNFSKYLSFGEINKDIRFSERGTKTLINCLLNNFQVEKIFIEPHLKERMNLNSPRIRYHGCGAVRHDDHIHIQVR